MTPNPILKVLFTFQKHKVKSLLIGGQACIVYGAAEFSRDTDFTILGTEKNIYNLSSALQAMKAELIYVPPLEIAYLKRGHACHFRCQDDDLSGLRIDLMAKLKGCPPFTVLWERRNIVKLDHGPGIDVISLKDLVQSKKTQRDKDWFMLKRLVDNDILTHKSNPSLQQVRWWLLECRDNNILVDLAVEFPCLASRQIKNRPLLKAAITGNKEQVRELLTKEETEERGKDITYWRPLREELEILRHTR
ncbi:MAG: hypothetical protein HY920_08875 [Elusimicrobia bacterium]|nr:hypothetical protein [Elusimicrobiota bacterium]